jgi:hypothetical protein
MSIVQEVFAFVKRNLSEAQRRKEAASGEKGCGERGGSPCPRLSTQWPGARQRSEQERGTPVNALYGSRPMDAEQAFP